eukprot:CAMPEP_0173447942 /NCGR_PEP_ID=MMETSP1357-20121228/39716_1 /TAXON_ID=77926 /ORGANISM="Hemiselmis rufescens, Strain PCC563" /LENGTH=134 /DNA_ID=CAMNT_0014414377 /DNA_START=113 /DNA_END=513 /DNA_ORIENTATION=+
MIPLKDALGAAGNPHLDELTVQVHQKTRHHPPSSAHPASDEPCDQIVRVGEAIEVTMTVHNQSESERRLTLNMPSIQDSPTLSLFALKSQIKLGHLAPNASVSVCIALSPIKSGVATLQGISLHDSVTNYVYHP